MSEFVTIAEFDNGFEVELALAKDALETAGINFHCINENARSVEPMPFTVASPIAIELRVPLENRDEAIELLEMIQHKE